MIHGALFERDPKELRIIEAVQQLYPALKQVACFDTAFHRQMPDLAQRYALPGHLRNKGVIRYGFHGLSCEYLTQELRRQTGPEAADGRVVIAHLGNGARDRGLPFLGGMTICGSPLIHN